MTERQRKRVVASLPSEFEATEACLPAGEWHLDACVTARHTLRKLFESTGRRVYIAVDMAVYYPNLTMFSPDLFAVLDVELHKRSSWIVQHEGKGLDICIECVWDGSKTKDVVRNVELYARLGIREYFVFDIQHSVLKGYRLLGSRRRYTQLVPQHGRFSSEVLGLDIAINGDLLRFFDGDRAVLDADEQSKEDAASREQARQQAAVEAERARVAIEEKQAAIEEKHAAMAREHAAIEEKHAALQRAEMAAARARIAEQELAEARATIEALKKK